MPAENPDDVVRLATAQNPMQAHLWEQALRQAGIRCKVVGDYLDAGIGDIPGVRAEAILAEGEAREETSADEEP